MQPMIRSFIAIPLTSEIHATIAYFYRDHHLDLVPGLRCVKPENIHITLKFLGDTPPIILEQMKEKLTSIASAAQPFPIRCRSLGVFPNWRNPRVIWIGVSAPTEMTTLADDIEKAMSELGFPAEGRGFNPHLTIGRINNKGSDPSIPAKLRFLEKLPAIEFGELTVSSITLFSSDLRPSGPIYTALSTHRFSGKPVP